MLTPLGSFGWLTGIFVAGPPGQFAGRLLLAGASRRADRHIAGIDPHARSIGRSRAR